MRRGSGHRQPFASSRFVAETATFRLRFRRTRVMDCHAQPSAEATITTPLQSLTDSSALLIRERIGADLEMSDLAVRPFSGLAMERSTGAPGGPDSFAFPAGQVSMGTGSSVLRPTEGLASR
jgi:hypothetical protein